MVSSGEGVFYDLDNFGKAVTVFQKFLQVCILAFSVIRAIG